MTTYDRNRNAITTGSRVMVSGTGILIGFFRFKGDDGKAEKTYQNTVALTPEDVSEAVWWVSTLPAHVNINTLEMMPVTQSYAGLNVHRQ